MAIDFIGGYGPVQAPVKPRALTPGEPIFTIADARRAREEIAEKITALICEFERCCKVRVESITVTRNQKKDRRGLSYQTLKAGLIVRLREGTGMDDI